MGMSTDIPAQESLDALVIRHRQELRDVRSRLEREHRKEMAALKESLNQDTATALAETLAAIETRLSKASQMGNLHVIAAYGGLSPELNVCLRQAQNTADEGQRAVAVVVPKPTSTGHHERKAWVIADVSDVVWR